MLIQLVGMFSLVVIFIESNDALFEGLSTGTLQKYMNIMKQDLTLIR